VKALRKKRGKNVWVVGGGTVVSALLAAHLIDELRVFVHPIVLGKGIPLFTGISRTAKLRLSRTKRFSSGLVEMAYTALPRARNRKP
jgi:dihydrofolate reductase